MPSLMYSEAEVKDLIRLGWSTGIRDAVYAAQGEPLDEQQAATLARFVADRGMLEATVRAVLKAWRLPPSRAGALAEQA